MKEDVGDLWEYPADIRIITTNGVLNRHGHLVMGRGCALEAKERYPTLAAALGYWVRLMGNVPYYNPGLGLATLPTKHHWREDSDIELIKSGLVSLASIVGEEIRFVLPRPGCGSGRLKWDDVRPVCEEILDDRFTVLTKGV